MKPLRCLLPSTLLTLLPMVSSDALALGDETFTLVVGGSLSQFNSEIMVNGKVRDNNARIDLEDDLDLDEDIDFVVAKAVWRFYDRHRISVEYNPFSRKSQVTLDEDLEFEDNVIHAGGDVSTESRFRIFDINYIYSFYQTPELEIGVSGGIYWVDFTFETNASAFIEDENGTLEYDDSYSNSVKSDLPLPLLGVYLNYQLAKNWELYSGLRYFDAEFDAYNGSIVNLVAGIDYSLMDHLAVGLSVASFDLKAGADENNFNGELGWEYSGAQLYLKLQY